MYSWIAIAIAATQFAWAGADSGGGDNFKPEHGAAWFEDSAKDFTRCYESASDFGASEAEVDAAFQKALGKWRDYFDSRGLTKAYIPIASSKGFSLSSTLLPKCDGTEDLKIYLGVKDARVKKAAEAYDNPTAFPYRDSFDNKTMWGKGFIWMAKEGSIKSSPKFPAWNSDQLLTILLHEVGHVLGSEHMNSTVMDARISEIMLNSLDPRSGSRPISEIDGQWELIQCAKCSYTKKLNVFGSSEEAIFQSLAGRKQIGDIWETLELHSPPVSVNVGSRYVSASATITYKDDKGSYSFWFENAGSIYAADFQSNLQVRFLASSTYTGVRPMGFLSGGVSQPVRIWMPNGSNAIGHLIRNSTQSRGTARPIRLVSYEIFGTAPGEYIADKVWFEAAYR